MAKQPSPSLHEQMMNAFDMADRNTPRDKIGRARYGMGANGLPRTPAQQASVKKAALASATARGSRAAPSPVKPAAAPGGLGIVKSPKKGLLSL